MSCSKDGADGAVGPQGEDGTDGIDGNVNVQNFVFTSAIGNNGRTTLNIPEITQSVVNNDVVLGFIQSGQGGIVGLPLRNGTNTIIDGSYKVGSYSFQAYDENNAQIGFSADNYLNSFYAYRVVIIESSSTIVKLGNGTGKNQSLSKSQKKTIIDELSKVIDINDYHAVCNYYGITNNIKK